MARKQRDIRIPQPHADETGVRLCDAPGCMLPSEHRAPRSRGDLNNFYWFCLAHVRDYNRQWNYYAGLSPEEIEKEIRAATTWWRPTWPLGVQGSRNKQGHPHVYYSAFGMEHWEHEQFAPRGADAIGWRPRRGSEEEHALGVFDMNPPVTRDDIKARYKVLVKRHHPDANGGDKDAEERLKIINRAYSALIAVPDL
ncbi:MAG: J domain-containing protein [Alphaproteobacteria bacterium]